VPEQVRRIRDPGAAPARAGARKQNHQHLLLVVATERTRIAGQQPTVTTLELNPVTHARTRPELESNRVMATLAFARKRSAS
jgi:hypothetical protein